MTKNRKKIGLALGSGGARGFCHLGVLKVFEENGIRVDCLAGCSMGSLIGGCYCAGAPVDKMIELAPKITQMSIMDLNISNKKAGLVKGQRAMRIVGKLVGSPMIENCKIPFAATATELCSGELVTFTKGSMLDAIRASISIPGVFHVVTDNDSRYYVDGGVLQRIPIPAVKALGADIVIAVDAIGPVESGFDDTNDFFGVLQRSINLMDWLHTKNDITEADYVITPDQGFKNTFTFKENEASIESGIVAAQKALPDIKKLIGE